MEEVINEGHEGDTEDREVSVIFLFEVGEYSLVFYIDGAHLFAFADHFFELICLKFFLIHG